MINASDVRRPGKKKYLSIFQERQALRGGSLLGRTQMNKGDIWKNVRDLVWPDPRICSRGYANESGNIAESAS